MLETFKVLPLVRGVTAGLWARLLRVTVVYARNEIAKRALLQVGLSTCLVSFLAYQLEMRDTSAAADTCVVDAAMQVPCLAPALIRTPPPSTRTRA